MSTSRPRKLIVGEGDASSTYEVLQERITLGREHSCDVAIEDKRASRLHGEIRRQGDILCYEDLGSANGTLLNGKPVMRSELASGDVIEIGSTRIHVDRVRAGTTPAVPTPERPMRSRRARAGRRSTVAAGLVGALVLAGVVGFLVMQEDGPGAPGRGAGSRIVSEAPPASPDRDRPSYTPAGSGAEVGRHDTGSIIMLIESGELRRARDLMGRDPGADLLALFEQALGRFERETRVRAEALRLTEGPRAAADWVQGRLEQLPAGCPAEASLTLFAFQLLPRIADDAGTVALGPGDGPAEAFTRADLEAGAGLLARAREALEADDLELARTLFGQAALSRVADVASGARRSLRLMDSRLALCQALAEAWNGNQEKVGRLPFMGGDRISVTELSAGALTVDTGSGPRALPWRVVPAVTLAALVHKLPLSPERLPDAAAVLYSGRRTEDADALLAKALERDQRLKQAIDQVIADARELRFPPGGFTWYEGRWLGPAEMARVNLNDAIAAGVKQLGDDEAGTREAGFQSLLSLGDPAASALHRALLMNRAEILEQARKSPAWGAMEGLAKLREELDVRRKEALDLIFDEVRYPYPYKPPAVSKEVFQTYVATQREVTALTQRVADVWNDPRKLMIPDQFRLVAARLREIDTWILRAGFGALPEATAWLGWLPPGTSADIRNVALDERDRSRIDGSATVMALNESDPQGALRGEVDQARITNEYRMMMGRFAVRVHAPMVRASRGHCQDMTRLGFFAHDSPVEGKRTPSDRLAREGMTPSGAGENIAISGGPASAHAAWLTSPGHHRNILNPAWRLMGPGNDGRHWCQVFSVADRTADQDKGE